LRLGELCPEKAQSVDPYSLGAKSFRYIDITAVDVATKRVVGIRDVPSDEAPSRARQVVRKGDVLVSTTRPNLNAVARIGEEFDRAICSTGFAVLRAGPNLDSGYLFWFVQSPLFVDGLSALTKGALYPAVSERQVREQWLSTPPLTEQHRIVAALAEFNRNFDSMRQAIHRQLADLDAFSSTTLRGAFSGDL
jgi:type I restriction enzyme S subunit